MSQSSLLLPPGFRNFCFYLLKCSWYLLVSPGCLQRSTPPWKKGITAFVFGILDLLAAVAYAGVVFVMIPSRYGWFNLMAAIVCATLVVGGVGMLTRRKRGLFLGAIGSGALLIAGLAVIWGLFASAAYLYGIYGGFGRGAAFVELVCLLPVVQLWWLRRVLARRSRE